MPRSHVHLAIRKLSFAPEGLAPGLAPRGEGSKKPTFGGGPINMVVTLDREVMTGCDRV